MDKLEQLKDKLRENFMTYKKWILAQNINIVFEKSYETAIKYELSEFTNYNYLNEKTLNNLADMNNPLDFLYQEYLKADGVNITNELNILIDNFQCFTS